MGGSLTVSTEITMLHRDYHAGGGGGGLIDNIYMDEVW